MRSPAAADWERTRAPRLLTDSPVQAKRRTAGRLHAIANRSASVQPSTPAQRTSQQSRPAAAAHVLRAAQEVDAAWIAAFSAGRCEAGTAGDRACLGSGSGTIAGDAFSRE